MLSSFAKLNSFFSFSGIEENFLQFKKESSPDSLYFLTIIAFCTYGYISSCFFLFRLLMLSWAVMISLCHADMRLPGYLSWNVSFDGADLSAPSRKELVHTSMLCQHFKRRDDGTGICLFHSAVMPEAFLIPEEICQ